MFQGGNSMSQGPSEAPKSNLSPAALEVAPVLQEITQVYREIKDSNGKTLIASINDIISKKMRGETDPILISEVEINLKLAEGQVKNKLREKYGNDPEVLDQKITIVHNYFTKLTSKNLSSDSMAA